MKYDNRHNLLIGFSPRKHKTNDATVMFLKYPVLANETERY
jgi:hypothetical protein